MSWKPEVIADSAAMVAAHKAKRPERYCPVPRCLWYTGGKLCPRHRVAGMPGYVPLTIPQVDSGYCPVAGCLQYTHGGGLCERYHKCLTPGCPNERQLIAGMHAGLCAECIAPKGH